MKQVKNFFPMHEILNQSTAKGLIHREHTIKIPHKTYEATCLPNQLLKIESTSRKIQLIHQHFVDGEEVLR